METHNVREHTNRTRLALLFLQQVCGVSTSAISPWHSIIKRCWQSRRVNWKFFNRMTI